MTLTATPNIGWNFAGWSGACAGREGRTCEVTIDGARDVRARFTSPRGRIESAHTFGDDEGSNEGVGAVVDPEGNTIVVGVLRPRSRRSPVVLGDRDACSGVVAKFSRAGEQLWSKHFGGSRCRPVGVGILPSSRDVVIAGNFRETIDLGGGRLQSAGDVDVFLARLRSRDGGHVWSKRFGGAGEDLISAIAATRTDEIALAGSFAGRIDLGGGAITSAGERTHFVARYDANGRERWSRGLEGTGGSRGPAMGADDRGDVVVTGLFQGTIDLGAGPLRSAGEEDVFLVKLRGRDGAPLWSKRFGSPQSEGEFSLAVSPEGGIALMGCSPGATVPELGETDSVDGGMGEFIARLGPSGERLWAVHVSMPSCPIDGLLAFDADRNVLVAGDSMGRVNLGGGELHTHMTSHVGVPARIYLGLLNGADGSNLWARTYGDDDGKARCGGLAVAADGRIVLVGGFGRSVDEPEFVRMMGMPEPPSTPFRWDLGDHSLTLVAPGARAMFVLNVLP